MPKANEAATVQDRINFFIDALNGGNVSDIEDSFSTDMTDYGSDISYQGTWDGGVWASSNRPFSMDALTVTDDTSYGASKKAVGNIKPSSGSAVVISYWLKNPSGHNWLICALKYDSAGGGVPFYE